MIIRLDGEHHVEGWSRARGDDVRRLHYFGGAVRTAICGAGPRSFLACTDERECWGCTWRIWLAVGRHSPKRLVKLLWDLARA